MKIRKAILKDAPKLNHFLTLLIRDEKQYNNDINENFVVTNMYENYIDDPTKILLVAEENKTITGYLYGFIQDSDATSNHKIAQLDALYVLENYRHQGIAKELIHNFKNWVLNNNISKIEVNVCSQNYQAKNLYIKEDFITTKETMTLEIK